MQDETGIDFFSVIPTTTDQRPFSGEGEDHPTSGAKKKRDSNRGDDDEPRKRASTQEPPTSPQSPASSEGGARQGFFAAARDIKFRPPRKAPVGGKWTEDEDRRLRDIVEKHGAKNWKKLSQILGSVRSDVQCLHRWNKVLRPGLSKGPWTAEEDKTVKEMVLTHGAGNVKWSIIAAQLPGRIGKQCRERWTNHLDPNLKKGGWTHEEDTILAEAQQRWGNAWTKIAKLLPGRAENAVKNRWNSAFRRKKSAMFGKSPVEEDTVAIAKARAAMELLDRDERETGSSQSNGSQAGDVPFLSSSSSSDLVVDTQKMHSNAAQLHHVIPVGSNYDHHAAAAAANAAHAVGGPSSGGGPQKSARKRGQHLSLPNHKLHNNNGLLLHANNGLLTASEMLHGNAEIPALRIPTSAIMNGLDSGEGGYVECSSSSSNHPGSSFSLDVGNVDSESTPREVLELFGADFENTGPDMDESLLSLDGVDDDEDDHCDLDVSLDNLDVVESRFDHQNGTHAGGPHRALIAGHRVVLSRHRNNRGAAHQTSHHHPASRGPALSHHGGATAGGAPPLPRGGQGGKFGSQDSHQTNDTTQQIDHDGGGSPSPGTTTAAPVVDHRPHPLALSRSPLPNCPEEDNFFYAGRTGLTPSGPMQKTPHGMLQGLTVHDLNASNNSFSPFADCENAVAHSLDPEDLAIELPVAESFNDGLRIDHEFLNSPNAHDYHPSWGLPAPEVRVPNKVSELLRSISTATDVTVISSPP
mmetsp:Transcript_27870/g.85506  ORF Transcript_27870/g.85506 Transcript_27870/m.85506 type:complete len:751 (+) Transcript_27870:70-2322(+)